ncbi:TnsA-like heteromeric transposase endonuclease subunit [Streptomyces luteogriseus]|uniref:TnsA-like heteromeric transposase endonuclease subunit n=1 Tax=Streptomyces luteogriseus TaxID=68233 RepID=UPI0036E8BB02
MRRGGVKVQNSALTPVPAPGTLGAPRSPTSGGCTDVAVTGRFSCVAGQVWRCVEYVIIDSSQEAASSAVPGAGCRIPEPHSTGGAVRREEAAAVEASLIDVRFRDPLGCSRQVPWLEAAQDVPFEDSPAVRPFPVRYGRRVAPGWWWSSTSGRLVAYGSGVMRTELMLLDRDPAVVALACRPVELVWREESRVVGHAPQLMARLQDGSGLLLDTSAWAVSPPGTEYSPTIRLTSPPVSTVESFSNLSGVVAHSAVQIMSMVKSSVENILRLSSTSLRLGVSDSFFPDNPLRAGYHVGIGAEAGSVDGTRLWLVNGTLREGPDPMVASPYRKHDYFVVQVERVEVRHDWAALPGIASYSEQFDAVLTEGTGTAAKRERLRLMWPGFDAALRGSVQLTARQAAKIATDVAEDLKRRLEALDQGNPFEDKSSDPDLNGLDATRFELAAVPDHVAPVDAVMPVAPFG